VKFIVFDIEATCWEGRPPSMTQEIIEIGALSIDQYGEVRGAFSKFIKPVLNPSLSIFCRQLTTIEQTDINRAREFPQVIEAFQDWIDIFDEDYLLCSWGNFDRKMLIQDCQLHRLDSEWAEQHINLKQQYQEIKRLPRPRGLKTALKAEGFEFTGTHHRGIDDAENLAKIFVKYLDMWQY
jgi:inhibitor of KinA sporulation pathway (predicted exonuclease)